MSTKCLPVLFLLLLSCNFNLKEKVVPDWNMEILGPLVKGDFSINNITELDYLHGQVTLSLASLGVPQSTIPVTIPGISPKNLGSFGLNLTKAFAKAEFESGELYFTINNGLEVNVKKNTSIVISDGGTVLLTDVLTNDISALNGSYVSPITDLADKTISTQLTLTISNFSSSGTAGPVLIDPSRKLEIDVYIKNVKVKAITISPGEVFSVADTADFSINGGKVNSTSVSGTFTNYVTNSFPVDLSFQLYFLDNTKSVVLDSMFDSPASINYAAGGGIGETQWKVVLNNSKIQNLNNASYARIAVKGSTGGDIVIPNSLTLKMQLVGDLKVKVSD